MLACRKPLSTVAPTHKPRAVGYGITNAAIMACCVYTRNPSLTDDYDVRLRSHDRSRLSHRAQLADVENAVGIRHTSTAHLGDL